MTLKHVVRVTLLCWLLLQGLPAGAQIPTIPTDSSGRPAAPCQFLNTTTNRWQSCDDVTGLPIKVTNPTAVASAITPPAGIGVSFTAVSTPASTGATYLPWTDFLTDYNLVLVRALAGGTPLEAWYSYDRGRTWTLRYSVANPAGISSGRPGLLVRSSTTWLRGAANGGGADLGKVFISSADGGRTWSLSASVGALATEVHVLGYSGSRVVAGTCNDWKLWTSDNFGGSWTERQTIGATTCVSNEAKFLGSNTWLVGWGGQLIYRSTDNGVTWTQVYNHGSGSGVSFAVVNSTTILAVFGTASVVKSTDTGATWSVVATLPGGSVRAQGILSSQGIALVTGQDQTSTTGHYWRSTDTGTTWSDGGTLPVYPECASGFCPSFPRVNSLGDVVLAMRANDSVSAEVQYSPVKLQGEMTLFDATGTALGSTASPMRVAGTVTANQGTAGSAAWLVNSSPAAASCKTTTVNSQGVANADVVVDATVGGVTVLPASTTRCGSLIENSGTADMRCGPTAITVTSTVGFLVAAGQALKLDSEGQQAWKCIRTTATSTSASVAEATP